MIEAKFLKAAFHKLYLVHSSINCLICNYYNEKGINEIQRLFVFCGLAHFPMFLIKLHIMVFILFVKSHSELVSWFLLHIATL